MIRVTIEMLPLGSQENSYPMHIIEIENNITTSFVDPRYGTYKYRISRKFRKGGSTARWHKEGVVENFPRAAKNVVHLLLAVLKDGYEK